MITATTSASSTRSVLRSYVEYCGEVVSFTQDIIVSSITVLFQAETYLLLKYINLKYNHLTPLPRM